MIEIYCDESRPEVISGTNPKERYMIIGGLWVPLHEREDLKNGIKKLKVKHNLHGEFKWNKVSPSREQFYIDLVSLFFASPVRFRCIVVDNQKFDLDKYHDSDSELGFYKFYYHMLYHWIYTKETYWIYLDYKKNKDPSRLHTLKDVLMNKTYSRIRDVQAIDSKQSLLIQMTDVLIGAIGYSFHGYYSSNSKLEVVNTIQNHIGWHIQGTPRSEAKFNIFNISLRGE